MRLLFVPTALETPETKLDVEVVVVVIAVVDDDDNDEDDVEATEGVVTVATVVVVVVVVVAPNAVVMCVAPERGHPEPEDVLLEWRGGLDLAEDGNDDILLRRKKQI